MYSFFFSWESRVNLFEALQKFIVYSDDFLKMHVRRIWKPFGPRATSNKKLIDLQNTNPAQMNL